MDMETLGIKVSLKMRVCVYLTAKASLYFLQPEYIGWNLWKRSNFQEKVFLLSWGIFFPLL